MENLKFWNSVERTDPSFTKRVTYGKRSFTTIDAYYQIKIATEKWGMYGNGWGVKNEELSFQESLLVYSGTFYYTLDGEKHEFPIASSILWKTITETGKVRIDDECVKKVRTDALTKGFSFLGMNADIFLGRFDDDRYVKQMEKEFKNTKPTAKETVDLLLKSGMSVEEAKEFCHKSVGSKSSSQWTSADIEKIKENLKFWEQNVALKKGKGRGGEGYWPREERTASA